MSRSLPMNGRAMLAMVASSTTISWAIEMSTRARPSLSWPFGLVTTASRVAPSSIVSSSDMWVSLALLRGRGRRVGCQRGGQDDLVDHLADRVLVGRKPHQEETVQTDAGECRREQVEVDALAELATGLGPLEDQAARGGLGTHDALAEGGSELGVAADRGEHAGERG